ncbi:MAG: response regulator [Candidatus Devosia phytovorans]|uniref:Response regulator n=1 Tax=Candidatus Devosia phytovorans TaxID=3121372 RepID=A0AAJ6B023_9HYPH|nr:response regulator [Devosia sp.]WEK04732.1 MAG: response regulator [Devosia sp.]
MATRVTVLIVEDEVLVRMALADHLEDVGYHVLEANDADEAIEVLEREDDVRVIFTDIDMPGSMDGLKLAAAVADRWPPIRIIITSGRRMVEITDIPSGSVFFMKPYSHRLIERQIGEMLTSR